MENVKNKLIRGHYILIKTAQNLLILFILLGIIIFFVARSRIDTQTRQLALDLETIYYDYLELEFVFDQSIPIELEIPLNEIIDLNQFFPGQIPIEITVPINTAVRIDQVFEVPLRLPLGGTIMLDVPINTTIPIEEEIPISTMLNIDQDILGEPEQVITVSEDLPVNIPILLEISPSELGIAEQMTGFTGLINTLRFLFLLGPLNLERY